MMIADPRRYAVAPPPGVIVFDADNTSLLVRMVVRRNHRTLFFIEQEPVSSGRWHCEVSFQYEL